MRNTLDYATFGFLIACMICNDFRARQTLSHGPGRREAARPSPLGSPRRPRLRQRGSGFPTGPERKGGHRARRIDYYRRER
jgi:hypothetical protein